MKKLSKEEQDKLFKEIEEKRHIAKTTNFSATYGAGPGKIAETAKISFNEGKKLHKIYWERNWAVKETARACKIKTVGKQKWLYNPVSGFWMFLKAEKDKFSTLNQSTGVYVFDSWLKHVREGLAVKGIKVVLQYHDELLLCCDKRDKDFVEKTLKEAMILTNKTVNLNVEIDISIDWGKNYAECH